MSRRPLRPAVGIGVVLIGFAVVGVVGYARRHGRQARDLVRGFNQRVLGPALHRKTPAPAGRG
jgi:hypothetical protein